MASKAIAGGLLLALAQVAATAPTPPAGQPCVEFKVPVSASAVHAVYNVSKVDDDISATAFGLDFGTRLYPDLVESLYVKSIPVSGVFSINAKLCVPLEGAYKDTLQLATHGFGLDSRYWDVKPYNAAEEYSYVDAALADGYSILIYDRLGTGKSDHPDAYEVVQAPIEVEILAGLTEMARNGSLQSYADLGVTQFQKVVHVGHSYGTYITAVFLTNYGHLSDGSILTGAIPGPLVPDAGQNWAGGQLASSNSEELFGDLPGGYVLPGSVRAFQTGFFSTVRDDPVDVGGFEPQLLDYAFTIRQPGTVGELISKENRTAVGPALNFTGPVQFFTGEYDFLGCFGNCNGAANMTYLQKLFPKASTIDVFLQPNTGHGTVFHKGAQAGYKIMLDFFHKNGL